MLFKRQILAGIAAGKITVAFRRWKRPTVKESGTLQTPVGQLAIKKVAAIDDSGLTLRGARAAGFDSLAALRDSLGKRPGTLYRIEFALLGEDPRIALRQQAELTDEELQDLQLRLGRFDKRSSQGPWTIKVLRIIADNPARPASELADALGAEKAWLKINVRKLKNLGLTESLPKGYQISPRGQAYLAMQ